MRAGLESAPEQPLWRSIIQRVAKCRLFLMARERANSRVRETTVFVPLDQCAQSGSVLARTERSAPNLSFQPQDPFEFSDGLEISRLDPCRNVERNSIYVSECSGTDQLP